MSIAVTRLSCLLISRTYVPALLLRLRLNDPTTPIGRGPTRIIPSRAISFDNRVHLKSHHRRNILLLLFFLLTVTPCNFQRRDTLVFAVLGSISCRPDHVRAVSCYK